MRIGKALWIVGILLSLVMAANYAGGQASFGPIRDWLATATAGSGQRDFSLDLSTTPPRLEGGRSIYNGFRISGNTVGASPTATACVGGVTNDTYCNWAFVGVGAAAPTMTGTHASGIAFFPAPTYCKTDVAPSTAANLIPTRVAANDWALARTAVGAETFNLFCDLNLNMSRSTASKGIRLDGISISYEIRGGPTIVSVALTSQAAPTLRRTTYAATTANSIDATGLTLSGTMATATQTTPYLTGLTISSASFMVTANTNMNLDWQIVMANTGIYRLYGVAATYSHALY